MSASRHQSRTWPPEERARYEKRLRRGWLFYATAWIVLIITVTGSRYFTAADNLAAGDRAHSTVAAARR